MNKTLVLLLSGGLIILPGCTPPTNGATKVIEINNQFETTRREFENELIHQKFNHTLPLQVTDGVGVEVITGNTFTLEDSQGNKRTITLIETSLEKLTLQQRDTAKAALASQVLGKALTVYWFKKAASDIIHGEVVHYQRLPIGDNDRINAAQMISATMLQLGYLRHAPNDACGFGYTGTDTNAREKRLGIWATP